MKGQRTGTVDLSAWGLGDAVRVRELGGDEYADFVISRAASKDDDIKAQIVVLREFVSLAILDAEGNRKFPNADHEELKHYSISLLNAIIEASVRLADDLEKAEKN